MSELIEYREHTAGALMNTEYVALPQTATVHDAIGRYARMKNCSKSLNTIFLVDGEERLTGDGAAGASLRRSRRRGR